MKKMLFLFALTHALSMSYAQIDTADYGPAPVVGVHLQYGVFQPAGKLADRFGYDNAIVIGLDYLTPKDWVVGGEFSYFFGKKVKEDPLAKLRTPEGYVIGNDAALADVFLRERGFYLGGYFGHTFSIKRSGEKKDRVNGLRLTAGAGWLQHKIRIQDDTNSATQVSGPYLKGYDRQTGGPALTQFIGYQYYSRQQHINFFAGLNVQEGFTKSMRSYNFDEMRADTERRFDARIGLVAGWTLPFYIGDKGEDIYY